jgi:hypothetical protein
MKKRIWTVTIPGHNPFRIGGCFMSYFEALDAAQALWPTARVA